MSRFTHQICRPFLLLPFRVVLAAASFVAVMAGSARTVCAEPASSSSGEVYSIDDVVVEGNRRIDTAAIRAQIEKKSGKIDAATISNDIKALYRTGFFDQVTASVVTGAKGGKTILKLTVIEKPIVRKVFIKGNKKVKEDELAEVIKLDAQRFLDKEKIDSLIRNATSYYQRQGYYDAHLEYSVVPVAEQQVDLTFNVTEGKRYKIREIKIRGASSSDSSGMLAAIQTTRYKWWSSWLMGTGRLNKDMLDNDKNLIRNYFLDHGYVDGSVSDPVIEKKEKGLYITFDVSPGEKYVFGDVTVTGDLIENSPEKTLDDIKMKKGDTFNASVLRDDGFKITDKFADNGFAFANIVPNTSVDRTHKIVNIEFSVDKGKPVSVNQINIHGNNKTYDHVIRRELKIDEQDLFSRAKVKRSQELLERLGYFEEVNIATEPTPGRNDQVDLNVNVREGSTGTFSIGAGYSSADGAIANTRVTENNLFGTGRSANLNVDVGTQKQNIVVSLNDRRLFDSYWGGGIDAYKTDRDFFDFSRRIMGGSLLASYPLEEIFGKVGQDVSFSTRYEYDDINISNVRSDAAVLVKNSVGKSSSSSVTPRLFRSTINNPLNPTKGSSQELSAEIAGLGGSQDFYILTARNVLYQRLAATSFGDFVFSWRTRVDYGKSNTDDPFPLFRRFFPGGINSIRGFKNRSLGPKDALDKPYGGAKEIVNNFEIIFPLINSAGINGVIFHDMGQAYDDHESMDFSEFRYAYGYGLRWNSPLGPIRIEFGLPISRKPGEPALVTLFSFGAPL